MNNGYSLREIQSELVLPEEFVKPYLVYAYDDFSFLINSVWRQYGGGYSGTPSELKPPNLEDIGRTYIAMAGNESNLFKFLEDYDSKVVLYQYDSILIDFNLQDGKEFLVKVKNIVEQDGKFPVKVAYGKNYNEMKDFTEKLYAH